MYADKAMSFNSTLKSLSVYGLLRGIKKNLHPTISLPHMYRCVACFKAVIVGKKARNRLILRADGVKI